MFIRSYLMHDDPCEMTMQVLTNHYVTLVCLCYLRLRIRLVDKDAARYRIVFQRPIIRSHIVANPTEI